MNLGRRNFLQLTAGAAALGTIPRSARAQAYPARPVHLIVGLSAGGGVDIIARLMGKWLSEHLGQAFIIENRPGASTNIATEYVTKSAPDGYTLLQAAPPNTINNHVYGNLNFDFIRDTTPVASVVRSPLVMLVNASFPVKSIPEFIAYAKANPGKINIASSGNGTPLHVAGELFKMMTGINMVHVPYKGVAPALTDLLAGHVQALFSDMSAIGYIKAGKLRALAVTTTTRSDVLPDVPVMADFIPGYEAVLWQGMVAPKNTPADVVDKLNAAVNAGLSDPGITARLAAIGYAPFASSPAAFGKFLADDSDKWAKVIKFAGIQPK
jgi:tripartite-type tricarboxylate transporter receptor subunit TctC